MSMSSTNTCAAQRRDASALRRSCGSHWTDHGTRVASCHLQQPASPIKRLLLLLLLLLSLLLLSLLLLSLLLLSLLLLLLLLLVLLVPTSPRRTSSRSCRWSSVASASSWYSCSSTSACLRARAGHAHQQHTARAVA
jgi:hypothetical protein